MKRWLKRIAVLAGLFIVLLAASCIWLKSEAGRNWLSVKLASALSTSGGKAVVETIQGNPLGAFSVLGVVLEDADGVWLSVDEIELDWRPLALLSGSVEITSLKIESALLLRLPGSHTKEPAGAGWKPSSVSIGELAIRFRTALGADAADQMPGYVLAGHALQLSPQGIRLDASLQPIHADGDSLQLAAEWSRQQNLLALDASLHGAPGGVLEALMGLAGQGPIEASLKGAGPLPNWQGQIEFKLGTGWGFASQLLVKAENLLAIQGRVFYPPRQDQPLKSLLGAESRFSGSLEVARLLQPSVDLLLQFPGADITLKGGLNSPDGAFFDDLDFAFKVPFVTVPLSAQQSISLQSAQGGFTLAARQKTFSLQLAGSSQAFAWNRDERPALVSNKTEWAIGARLDPETRVFELEIKQLALDWLSVAGKGTFERDFAPVSLDFTGTLENRVFAAAAKLPGLTGRTGFSASYAHNADTGASVISLDTKMSDFQSGLAGVDLLLGQQPWFDFSGEILPTGGWAVKKAQLAGTNFRLGLTGSVSAADALALDYSASLKTLAGLAPAAVMLEDGLELTGNISGDYKNPSLAAATRVESASLWGLGIEQLQARLTLDSLFNKPHGPLLIGGQTAMGALSVQSTLAWQENGDIEFAPVAADLASFLVAGKLAVLAEGGLRGALEGSFGQQELVMAGQGLNAEGNISLAFDLQDGAQEIAFLAGLQKLRSRDASGILTEIGQLTGSGNIILADQPGGHLELVLKTFYRDALVLDSITLDAELGDLPFINITGSGHYFEPLNFQLKLRGQPASPADNTYMIDFSSEYGGRQVRSSQPVALLLATDAQRLEFPAIQVGDGSVAGFIRRTGETLAAEVTANGLDMVFLTLPWQGLVSAGTLSGTLNLEMMAQSEQLRLEVQAQDLLWQDFPAFAEEPLSLNIRLDAHDGSLDSDSSLLRGDTRVGTIQTSFAYLREPILAIDHGRPINASIHWDGPVEPLWSLAGLHEHELNGHLRGEVRITGSIDAPAFSGSLDLDQGSYSYLTSGLNLQALTLSVTGDGNKLKINAFEATDGQGGSLKAEGAFELSSQLFFPGKVKITATDLSIVDLDSIKALASAQLVYLRSNNTASLSGSVKSRKIEAQLTQTLPISVVSIDVREINLPGRPNAEPLNRSVIKRPPLELDLAVEIPGRFMLRGRGLESEWQGKLSISGTTDVPLINGSATLVRGYFDFGGKHFSLDSGQLFFDGGREIDPRIELISRTRTSSIDAEIKISGNLSSPQVSMSSVPLLPEDEILSQLLFGASITELSAFQLAELASTLATITGKGGNLNFLSAARKRIGLDVLSVSSDPDIENGTLLTGGVYLSKDVFLEVETATSTGEVVTRLFYDISRRLRAESEVSQKKGNSLKLKWFWDY